MLNRFNLISSPNFNQNSTLTENILLEDDNLGQDTNFLSESSHLNRSNFSFGLNENISFATPPQPSRIYEEQKQSYNYTEFNSDDEDEDINDNEIYLCFLYQSGKLACSYYDLNKKSLFYLIDIQENLKFELTNLLIEDLEPQFVITCSKSDPKFINYLKLKCKFKVENHHLNEIDSDLDDQDVNNMLKKRQKTISFVMMPNNDFNYEISKERILDIHTIENFPQNMSESEKIVYFSGLFDFDSKLMIKSVGALLKHLYRNRINFELESNIFETPIYSVRPLSLNKLLILDSNSFKSLQIFNDVDLVCAYKQSYSEANHFRTTLNDKFNNTLYSLYLSKIQTKVGIGKLRSFMMKPTRDTDILEQRHKIIGFFYDYRNQEFSQSIRKTLKKCKYINPILKRMRITKCGLNEWKRLYKTTQAFLKICEHSRLINTKLTGLSTAPIHKKSNNNSESFFSFLLNSDLAVSSKSSSNKSENIFTNILANNYEAKFDYLIGLFDRTINLKESIEAKKCKINTNISTELDEKKLMYVQLSEFLTQVAESEMFKYNLNGCKITYLPLLGFLLVLTIEEMFDSDDLGLINRTFDFNDSNENFEKFRQEKLDLARAEFELKNEFKFTFKSDEKFYYKTVKCAELDLKIGDLAIEINDLESQILDSLQIQFIKYSHLYADMIDICAELDCLLAFAQIAHENNYTKPKLEFETGSFMRAKNSRHPLIELNFDSLSLYIPNDIQTGNKSPKVKVITGPNASGKTVYLKQIALLIYMTMIGSYVPASEASVGDFDRIYTRLNSNECISLQMSAFSIDLKQIAEAINGSSPKSLILIDEFGKGTNVCDGQALVASIIRHWINRVDLEATPHVYLSTHFYEMLQSSEILFKDKLDRIEFLTFDYMIESDGNERNEKPKLVFLYTIKQGVTKSSYAFNIAKRADLPDKIISKACVLLEEFVNSISCGDDSQGEIGAESEENRIKAVISQNENSIENFFNSKSVVHDTLKLNFDLKNDADLNCKSAEELVHAKASKWREFLKNKFSRKVSDEVEDGNTNVNPGDVQEEMQTG